MSYQVVNPFIQFVDSINGNPLSAGAIYFGRMDSDPKNQPANRINVYAVQDNGSEVLLSQPITLNGAGQPQYSGSVKQIKVELYAGESAYAIQVFNKNGAQKGYSPRVYSMLDLQSLADTASTVIIAGIQARQLRVIDGIKNLIAVPDAPMSVSGFYAGGLVGGGLFYYDETMSKANHNGGTVISPDAIAAWDGTQANLNTLLSWSGVGSGCFVREWDHTASLVVSWFGAVGDGVAIDTLPIQKAVSVASSAATNLNVFIPEGIFKISASILLDSGSRVPSIIGAGSSETTIITNGLFGAGVPMFSILRNIGNRAVGRNYRGFTLRDTAGVAHGFSMSWVSECSFVDVGLYGLAVGMNFVDVVYSCLFEQIKTSLPTGPSVVMRNESNQLLFSNCVLSGGTEGVRMIGSYSAVKFLNCDFENGSSYHIEVSTPTGLKGRGLSIDTCYFENGATFSIYIAPVDASGVEGFDIVSNYFIVQPALVVAPIILRNCFGGSINSNSASRYTGYFYNRDGTARRVDVVNNIYDAPALTNAGNYDDAFAGNLLAGNSTGASVSNGAGSPEGVLAASVGSTYTNLTGGAGTTFYVKESGTGNTGWVAK